jgi:predicted metal-dependent HD superfamily phosphohydrolase
VVRLVEEWTKDVVALSSDAETDAVAAAGADLLGRWSEPHRRYHSTQHLAEVIAALDRLVTAGEMSPDEAAVARVAAWLHDAVYDPAAAPGANEAASAELAARLLRDLGIDPERTATVVALVRMTADHAVAGGSPVERGFHDADLWILAAPADRFDDYCRQVREEYASVPDAVFQAARAAILRSLVGANGLYLTALARREWDGPARANLERELARLG